MEFILGSVSKEGTGTQVLNGVRYSCESTGNCCKQFTIPVTDEEVREIENHGYEVLQIVETLNPLLIPAKSGDGATKVYIMKRKPFTRECVFLEGFTCTIHQFKPLACKLYPFDYDLEGERIVVKLHSNNRCENVTTSIIDSLESEKIILDVVSLISNRED